jgi:hypothetical protein
VKRPSTSTTQWVATAACAFIAAGSLAVSVIFVLDDRSDDRKTDEAIHQILEQRTESRKNTCEKDLKFANAHNRLVIAIATGAGTHPISPELQPKVDEQLVKVPDCSPAGVKAFYEGTKP